VLCCLHLDAAGGEFLSGSGFEIEGGNGGEDDGVIGGRATVSVLGYSAYPGACLSVDVADSTDPTTRLEVVGLDYTVLGHGDVLGEVSVAPPMPATGYTRDTTVTISVQLPPNVVLKKEG